MDRAGTAPLSARSPAPRWVCAPGVDAQGACAADVLRAGASDRRASSGVRPHARRTQVQDELQLEVELVQLPGEETRGRTAAAQREPPELGRNDVLSHTDVERREGLRRVPAPPWIRAPSPDSGWRPSETCRQVTAPSARRSSWSRRSTRSGSGTVNPAHARPQRFASRSSPVQTVRLALAGRPGDCSSRTASAHPTGSVLWPSFAPPAVTR